MTASLANASAKDRPATDFYPTPANVTIALLDFLKIPPGAHIWEPACGQWHMVEAMRSRGYRVTGTDLYPTDGTAPVDFKQATEITTQAKWIITNPPFIESEAFIWHCAGFKAITGFAMLLKSQYWHSASRRLLFRETKPSFVLPLTWRPDFLHGAKGGNSTMEVCWTVWDRRETGFYGHGEAKYIPLDKPNA